MTQRTLDNKTDCLDERKKESCGVRLWGKNQEMIEYLTNLKKKYPCCKVVINNIPIEEPAKEWIARNGNSAKELGIELTTLQVIREDGNVDE
jgi:hypothetical protein